MNIFSWLALNISVKLKETSDVLSSSILQSSFRVSQTAETNEIATLGTEADREKRVCSYYVCV